MTSSLGGGGGGGGGPHRTAGENLQRGGATRGKRGGLTHTNFFKEGVSFIVLQCQFTYKRNKKIIAYIFHFSLPLLTTFSDHQNNYLKELPLAPQGNQDPSLAPQRSQGPYLAPQGSQGPYLAPQG